MHTGMQRSKNGDRYWEATGGGRQTQVGSSRERQAVKEVQVKAACTWRQLCKISQAKTRSNMYVS
jgi:hypothetical protein